VIFYFINWKRCRRMLKARPFVPKTLLLSWGLPAVLWSEVVVCMWCWRWILSVLTWSFTLLQQNGVRQETQIDFFPQICSLVNSSVLLLLNVKTTSLEGSWLSWLGILQQTTLRICVQPVHLGKRESASKKGRKSN
jgi:hypothetical protein